MLKVIKEKLKSDNGTRLMTRILKIALNFEEDMTAAVIVARYDFFLEDCMINYAIALK